MATTARRARAPERTVAPRRPARRGLLAVAALSLALVAAAAFTLRYRQDDAVPPAGDGHGHGNGNRSGAGQLITGAPAHPVPDAAVREMAAGLDGPSSLAVRPDGTVLVAERRSGRVLALGPDGQVTEVHRVAGLVADGGGGLSSVAVAPDGRVFLLHTTATDNRVVWIRPDGGAEPVLTGIPRGAARNGGALAFGPDRMLYVATGDAAAPADPASPAGKVLRVTPDGRAAPDNPVPGSMVYARGLRDPQGLAWYGQTDLFVADSGANPDGAPDRHDELNLVQAGGDYGWPAVTGFAANSRYVKPVAAWQPGEAGFGGLAVVGGRVYLAGTKLYRIWLEGTEPQTLLDGRLGRLRAAVAAPDGSLWLASATSVYRVAPEAL
jgi:glucose/arabinose dehydrogenase